MAFTRRRIWPAHAIHSTMRTLAEKRAYRIRVVGAQGVPFHRDLYHRFLRVPWGVALLVVVALFLFVNSVFAVGYLAVGGVTGMRPGSSRIRPDRWAARTWRRRGPWREP